ncbi:hypothetical protein V6K52_06540 [Knoellia sp. S7-12]|uniref:hypothetical protein n=1 Tax=Knoellia sp. S7-12 TaxID=3126698 RepID=UPI0033678DE2
MNQQTTLDAGWRRDFVVALRLRNVPAASIADHLKLVETHCAESGEPAQDAFGDPAAYAQSLAGSPADSVADLAPLLPSAVLGFLAGALTLEGIKGMLGDEDVTVRVGDLGGAVVLVGAALGVLVLLGRLKRPLLAVFVLVVAAVALAVVLDVADTAVLFACPAWLALAIGASSFAVLAVFGVRRARSERVSDPLSGESML